MKDLVSTGKIAAAWCLQCEGKRGPKNIQPHLKCAMRLNILVLLCLTFVCRHEPQSNQLLNTGRKLSVQFLFCHVKSMEGKQEKVDNPHLSISKIPGLLRYLALAVVRVCSYSA